MEPAHDARAAPGFEPPSHPASAAARWIYVFVALALGFGIWLAATGRGPLSGLLLGLAACWLVSYSRYVRRIAPAVQCVHLAASAASRGDQDRALALLDAALRHSRSVPVLWSAALQRARIAVDRGELERALSELDACLALRLPWLGRAQTKLAFTYVRGLRAMVRAALSQPDLALDDAAQVITDDFADPPALASAHLGQALAFQRQGRVGAVRELIARRERLLLEHLPARERRLLRALDALASPGASPYRVAAEPSRAAVHDAWLERFVPGAGSAIAHASRTVRPFAEQHETAAAAARGEAGTPRSAPAGGRLRPLRMLATGVLAVFAAFFAVSELPAVTSSGSSTDSLDALCLPAILIAAGCYAFVGLRAGRVQAKLRRAARLAALDDEAEAREMLVGATTSSSALLRGAAYFGLAGQEARHARFESALERCWQAERVLTSSKATELGAYDQLLPEVSSLIVVLLLAVGDIERADAALSRYERRYPASYLLDSLHRSRDVVLALRAADWAAAGAAYAGFRGRLVGGYALEALAELAALRASRISGGQLERFNAELKRVAGPREWAERIAPGLLVDAGSGRPIELGIVPE